MADELLNELQEQFLSNISRLYGAPLCYCEEYKVGKQQYQLSNVLLIMICLPLVATIGLVANITSFVIYTRPSMNGQSVNRYLAALCLSDCGVCICGIFIITADSVRGYTEFLNEAYAIILPKALPIILSTQMLTVYLTVAAAVDCFVDVWNPFNGKMYFCKTKTASWLALALVVIAFGYNAIVFWELETVYCYDFDRAMYRKEICQTDMRIETNYVYVFKIYMYTVFMACLPFILLLVLNILIILRVCTRTASADQEESSTMMLVMVVMLFLVCNSVSLFVNVMELFGESSAFIRNLLIDIGNFLVVFNSSANFFIYIIFSKQFRIAFVRHCCGLGDQLIPERANGYYEILDFTYQNDHKVLQRSITVDNSLPCNDIGQSQWMPGNYQKLGRSRSNTIDTWLLSNESGRGRVRKGTIDRKANTNQSLVKQSGQSYNLKQAIHRKASTRTIASGLPGNENGRGRKEIKQKLSLASSITVESGLSSKYWNHSATIDSEFPCNERMGKIVRLYSTQPRVLERTYSSLMFMDDSLFEENH